MMVKRYRSGVLFLALSILILPAIVVPRSFEKYVPFSQSKEKEPDCDSTRKSRVYIIDCSGSDSKACEDLLSRFERVKVFYSNGIAGDTQRDKQTESVGESDLEQKKKELKEKVPIVSGAFLVGLLTGMAYRDSIMGCVSVCLQWCVGGES